MTKPKLQEQLDNLSQLGVVMHSYVSHMLAYGQLSIKDREELAHDMCHSVNTQAQYQFITPKSKLAADKKQEHNI